MLIRRRVSVLALPVLRFLTYPFTRFLKFLLRLSYLLPRQLLLLLSYLFLLRLLRLLKKV
jgi:hypothetical protein